MDEPQYDGYSPGRARVLAFRGGALAWIQRTFTYLGLLMLLVMGVFLWKLWVLNSGGVTAAGRIAGFRESVGTSPSRPGRGGGGAEYRIYYPVIRFEAEGRSWEFVSNQGARGGPGYRIGQEVELVYKPGEPRKAELAHPVKTFSTLWMTAILFFISGAAFFLIGRWLLPRLSKSFPSGG